MTPQPANFLVCVTPRHTFPPINLKVLRMANQEQNQTFFNFDRNDESKRFTNLPSFIIELPTLRNPWAAIKKQKTTPPSDRISPPRTTPYFIPVRDLPQDQRFNDIPLSSFTPPPLRRSGTAPEYQGENQIDLPRPDFQNVPLNMNYKSSPHTRVPPLHDQQPFFPPQPMHFDDWSNTRHVANAVAEKRPASVAAFTARIKSETTIPDMSVPLPTSRTPFQVGLTIPGRIRTPAPAPAGSKDWWKFIRHPPGKLVLALFALPFFAFIIVITVLEVVIHTQKENQNGSADTTAPVGCIGCPVSGAARRTQRLEGLWIVFMVMIIREVGRWIEFAL
jgi:hypothetical protein